MDLTILYIIIGVVLLIVFGFIGYKIFRRLWNRLMSGFSVVSITSDDKRELEKIERESYMEKAKLEAKSRGSDNAIRDYRH